MTRKENHQFPGVERTNTPLDQEESIETNYTFKIKKEKKGSSQCPIILTTRHPKRNIKVLTLSILNEINERKE